MPRSKIKDVVRCISFPINGPADGEWLPLREALTSAWGMATSLANWAVTELLKRDPGRRHGDDQLRPYPPFNVYQFGLTNKRFSDWRLWIGAKGSASAILRTVWRKYMKERLAIQWQGARAASTFRYPVPWPVRAQGLQAYRSDDERRSPCLRLQLPGGTFHVRLRGGPEFARQLATFDLIIKGKAKLLEAKITRQRCYAEHGRVLSDREPGSRRQQFREMVRLSVAMKPPATKGRDLSLLVSTDANAFWVVQSDGRDRSPWLVNADHVVRREAEHDAFLQRISEDLKPEKRWPKKVRQQINEHREARCLKHNRFIDTWTKQAASMLASYCTRQGIGCVVYDDSCHTYCPGFAWYKQRMALANRLEQDGVQLIVKEKDVSDEEEVA